LQDGNKSSTTLTTESASLTRLRRMSNLSSGLEDSIREVTLTRERTT